MKNILSTIVCLLFLCNATATYAIIVGYNRGLDQQTLRSGVSYWWTANAATDPGDYGTAPTVTGTTTYVVGQVGNALECADYNLDYINLPVGVINGTSGRIGFWLKWSVSRGSATIFKAESGSAYIKATMGSTPTSIHVTYYDGTTTRIAYGTAGQFSDNTWYFFEFKWIVSGGNVTITSYLNGTQHGSATGTMTAIDLSTSSAKVGYVQAGSGTNILYIDNFIIADSSDVNINDLKSYSGAYQ